MIKVITNNPGIEKNFENKALEILFVQGHAKDVIKKCEDFISSGWRLAVDPLAGYFSRPNPFHTIILLPNEGNGSMGKDMTRLARTTEQWERYDNIIPVTERLLEDYKELDLSIAGSSMEGLLRNALLL